MHWDTAVQQTTQIHLMFKRWSVLALELMSDPRRRKQVWYVPILGIAMAIMMARLILLAGWLSLESFAALAFGLLISSSMGIIGALGLQLLLQRDLPGMLVRKEEIQAQCLMAQACLIAFACFVLALPIGSLGSLSSSYSAEVWRAGLLHGLAQQLFLIATTDSRSRGNPLKFASDNLLRACLAVAASWPVAILSGSASHVLLVEALVSIVLSAIAFRTILMRNATSLLKLLTMAFTKIGKVPWSNVAFLLSSSMLTYGLFNIDRWIASIWLSKEAFAQYAFIAIGLMIAQSLQSMVNAAALPLVARRLVIQGEASAFRMAKNLSLISLAVGVIFGPIVVLLSRQVVSLWLPQYLPAMNLAWPVCAIAVLRLSDFYSTYLLVAGRERALTWVNLAVFLLTIAVLLGMNHVSKNAEWDLLNVVLAITLVLAVIHYLCIVSTAIFLSKRALLSR
jgi:O-antigen/teichoic acid export membrane protein